MAGRPANVCRCQQQTFVKGLIEHFPVFRSDDHIEAGVFRVALCRDVRRIKKTSWNDSAWWNSEARFECDMVVGAAMGRAHLSEGDVGHTTAKPPGARFWWVGAVVCRRPIESVAAALLVPPD